MTLQNGTCSFLSGLISCALLAAHFGKTKVFL
nr:MAG TPA: hypothetical protein [Bacteriophage sp.]